MKKTLYFLLTIWILTACTSESVNDARHESIFPHIYPDYLGVTIPANIAPLNFCMDSEDADGHSIYFCAARALPQGSQQLDSIRYNLCRIDFDPATGNFGTHIDTIINAEAQHKSVSFPRPSYDGKFLCYTLSD